jgi:tetratricopeptide (TPR) repeat protein
MKKTIFITLICLMTAVTAQAQWLPGKSCTSTADAMMEQAIEHMVNIEGPFAVGMANAALMIDSDCGTAHLLKASLSLAGQFGDQAEKLEAIDTESLTKNERAWHTLMMNTPGDWQGARQTAAEENPGVPLFEFWAAMAMDNSTDAMIAYIEEFPEYASPAYNMLSYAYAQGMSVDQDLEKAIETIEKGIAAHDGPNAYDSKAEHLAEMGDYENAFQAQLTALNYAAGPSAYSQNAGIYWRNSNRDAWADSIRAYTEERIGYTMNNDMDAMMGMMSETVTNTSCNSNMGPCQELNPDELEENTMYTWDEWEVEDIYVTFNEEMNMAITNFISRGSYTMNDSGEEVAYHTRASEVWVLENGWKLAHSNFAPLPDGAGLPGEQ